MTEAHAHAARRGAFAAAALGATLAAHAVAHRGDLALMRHAVPAWAMLVGLSLLVGRRHGRFAARGAGLTFALLAAGQAVLHWALAGVPWAFGLRVHHEVPVATPAAIVTHLIAAIVLTGLLVRGQRLLQALVRVRDAIRRLLAPRARRRRAPMALTLPRSPAARRPALCSAPSRGPPG